MLGVAADHGGALVIVAIGTNGHDAVVWGLGDTEDDARRDAAEQGEPTWDSDGSACVVVTAASEPLYGIRAVPTTGVVSHRDGAEVTAADLESEVPS